MKKILKNEYNIREILWSNVILFMLVCIWLFLPILLNFNNDFMLPIIPLLFILWGIIAGLSYKDGDSFFYKFKIIKKPFLSLFIAVILCVIYFSAWIVFFDSIENMGFIENVHGALFFSIQIIAFFNAPLFFVGFIPAIIVRFFVKKIK